MLPEISQEFKQRCKEHGIPLNEGFMFAVMIAYKDQVPNLEQFFIDKEYWPHECWQPYQITLCNTNEELKPELKVPLFGFSEEGEYDKFLILLMEDGVGGRGHLNNELEYSIFNSISKVDRDAFSMAKVKLKSDWDVDKASRVVSHYYRMTKFAKNFANYIGSDSFIMDYKQTV